MLSVILLNKVIINSCWFAAGINAFAFQTNHEPINLIGMISCITAAIIKDSK